MSDSWKYVSVKQCIGIIIFSLISICIVFIPFTFGTEQGLILSYKFLPIIGEEVFQSYFASGITGVVNQIGALIPSLSPEILSYIAMAYVYSLYAFFGILLVNVIFALILALARVNVIRILFRIFSIFAGIAMIVMTLLWLGYIAVIVYWLVQGADFMAVIQSTGVTFAIGMFVFSAILIGKQFKWFTMPY